MMGYIVNPAPRKAPKRKAPKMAARKRRRAPVRRSNPKRSTRKGAARKTSRRAYSKRRPNPVRRRRPRRNPAQDVFMDALVAGGTAGLAAALNAYLRDMNDKAIHEAAGDVKKAPIPALLTDGYSRALVNIALGLGAGMILDRGKGALKKNAGNVAAGFVAFGVIDAVNLFMKQRTIKEPHASAGEKRRDTEALTAAGMLLASPSVGSAMLASEDVSGMAATGLLYEGSLPY